MATKGNREIWNLGEKSAKPIEDGAWALPLSSLLGAKGVCEDEDSAIAKEATAVVVESQDPLVVFGEGVMMIVLDKLDVRSLAVSRLVSPDWLTLTSSDLVWAPKCEELWVGKAHLPRTSKVAGLSKMEATSLSIMDGNRNQITLNDLCDHAWEFKFSEAAGPQRGPPTRHYFHADGSITEGEGGDRVWDDVMDSSFTLITKGKTGEQCVRINWLPYVCIWMTNWVPYLSVVRKQDWSWVLENSLYSYTSIPDATDKVDGTGPYAAQLF